MKIDNATVHGFRSSFRARTASKIAKEPGQDDADHARQDLRAELGSYEPERSSARFCSQALIRKKNKAGGRVVDVAAAGLRRKYG